MGTKVRIALPALALLLAGCGPLGPLGSIVQPPRFTQAPDRPAELRLLPPSLALPAGGAGVRLWLEVSNPNAFGFTLSTLETTLLVERTRAATGDFPLGLPLQPGQQTVVPLDLSISFLEVPGLAGVLRQVAAGSRVAYDLEGTVGVDAGPLGTPTFGPMRLVSGELRVVP